VDGSFGSATRDAVRKLQRAQGLEPTGVADLETRLALLRKTGTFTPAFVR
jgi:peptidoglycan hydrolase-like protein with peptidoglycan-binding domain